MMSTRTRHIWLGFLLILCFFLILGGIAACAHLPGFPGEVGRMVLAWITSPFIMESALFFIALTLLFAINGWRREREGDDYLELDDEGVPIRKK